MNFLIANEEEVVRHVYGACMVRVDTSKGFIVNIGAYDTNIIKFNRRNVVDFDTIPYGFSNLSASDVTFAEKVATIKKELKKCSLLKNFDEDAVVGCG